jgi:hypothetical protein
MPTAIAVASPAVASLAVVSPAMGVWDKFLAVVSNRDFIVVSIFATVAILFAVYLVFRFPDAGALIEQYNQF